MSNPWTDILSVEQLAARTASIAALDPSFAVRDQKFYSDRTYAQLCSLERQAWNCNNAEAYQVARSWKAVKGA